MAGHIRLRCAVPRGDLLATFAAALLLLVLVLCVSCVCVCACVEKECVVVLRARAHVRAGGVKTGVL